METDVSSPVDEEHEQEPADQAREGNRCGLNQLMLGVTCRRGVTGEHRISATGENHEDDDSTESSTRCSRAEISMPR